MNDKTNSTEQETIDWLEEYKKLTAPQKKPSKIAMSAVRQEWDNNTTTVKAQPKRGSVLERLKLQMEEDKIASVNQSMDWVKEYKRVTRVRPESLADIMARNKIELAKW